MKKFLLFLVYLTIAISCSKEIKTDENKRINEESLKSEAQAANATYIFENNIVPLQLAKVLAERINLTLPEQMKIGTKSSKINIERIFTIADSNEIPVLYIVNYIGNGFTAISADIRYVPILAVAEKGSYAQTEVPSALIEWFNSNFEGINLIRSNASVKEQFAEMEWQRVLKNIGLENVRKVVNDCCPECPNYPDCLDHPIGCGDPNLNCDPCGQWIIATKGPLVTTAWGQRCTYNELCPNKNCTNVCNTNTKAYTGCVATAMAQIIKYWAHPSHQNYNYATMPNNYGNYEVQRLMRDAGNSVNMTYGCDGSGAYSHNISQALKNTFGYSSANYSSTNLGYQTIIQNLDMNKPVIFSGCRTSVYYPWEWFSAKCHAWVCDGYHLVQNQCTGFLWYNMNWGWDNAYYNGWYYYNSWNPNGYNYQYAQDVIYNIQP